MEDNQEMYNGWFAKMLNKHLSFIEMSVQEEESNYGITITASIQNKENPKKLIKISDYGCEITFLFENYHCHFDSWSDSDHEEEFIEFKNFLNKFLNDEIFVIECYEDNRYTCGAYIESLDEISNFNGSRKVIQSWSGKFDSELVE